LINNDNSHGHSCWSNLDQRGYSKYIRLMLRKMGLSKIMKIISSANHQVINRCKKS